MLRIAHRTTMLVLLAAAVAVLTLPSLAEEGMWTFDNPPRKQLKEKYGFEPTQQWLDHLRLSSVRVGDGGSGSFVSANGLLITNHHVGRGQVQKLSTKDRDLIKDGFYARTQAEELKCPDMELNVLVSMEDVTEKVLGAVKPGMSAKEGLDVRKSAIAAITKESTEKTGFRSDIVEFYQGSEFWLYRYKKYTDVRLVMAPEMQIAFYGGDHDNFTFPRHDVDICFFRAYEEGKPANTKEFLKWNSKGADANDLLFVSGHPGSTNRLQTYAQTEYQRDFGYPNRLKAYKRSLELVKKYASRGPEQERVSTGQIFGLENGLKASTGEYEGLMDKTLMAKKFAEEKDLRDRVDANPEWKKAYGWAWDTVAATIERSKADLKEKTYRAVRGRLFGFAMQLVQYAEEISKPNGERLSPYQDANIASTKFRLFSPAPIYPELDELQMTDGFAESVEMLGPKDPFIAAILHDRTPEAAAKALVGGTSLANPEARKKLFEGGEAAVKASTDPMIVAAREVNPILKEMRLRSEKNISAPAAAASEAIGKARFAAYGKTLPPDATFTLRLSYGTMTGYPMNGTMAPPKTTLYGLYDRAASFNNTGAWALPKRYVDGQAKLNLATPLDFVSTHDIIGGNSGSPVVNRKGEFVGIIFDGNIESLPGRFLYTLEKNRAVSVHSAVITEVLRKLYDAGPLVDELEGVNSL
jgi:hypothetical protein